MPTRGQIKDCKYCGSKVYYAGEICSNCREKLRLIREIRAIIFDIKKRAEEEHESKNNKLRIF